MTDAGDGLVALLAMGVVLLRGAAIAGAARPGSDPARRPGRRPPLVGPRSRR
ncbi:hypothetical protein [Streptomyces marincola]|uniref:hypothetical protein n=1 Tax=Streptomyces marincola TaxID=2878388 RepID=UPI001CF42CDB|nr:hypothetical protein [Streptomyces marincola]UCM86518.1 hypothetical protein LC193_00335 [Streptomyces marincola]